MPALRRGPGSVGRALIAGGCPLTNIKIYIVGSPTGGTFRLAVTCAGVTENITFNYNENATDVKNKLATHSKIDAVDLTVTGAGGPLAPMPNQSILIESNLDITMTVNNTSLTGGFGTYVFLDKCTCQ